MFKFKINPVTVSLLAILYSSQVYSQIVYPVPPLSRSKAIEISPISVDEKVSPQRPCDFSNSNGLSIPVPHSADQPIGDIVRQHQASLSRPKPRLNCVNQLSAQSLANALLKTHMGMRCDSKGLNCRAGIYNN